VLRFRVVEEFAHGRTVFCPRALVPLGEGFALAA
jgi:hypothetical protein